MSAMSTPDDVLFARLLDDAAVFPPGNHPGPEAVRAWLARQGTADAALVGPLLLPPALVADALAAPEPLAIGVIGRPGSDLDEVLGAARAAAGSPVHTLAGIELAADSEWRRGLDLGVPLAVEIAAEDLQHVPALAAAGARAKLRLGATPAYAVPPASEVARFLVATVGSGATVKFTGGLHHPAYRLLPDGTHEFGFLNLILAVDAALTGGEVAEALVGEDARALAAEVAGLGAERAGAVRARFTSYGCCEVADPIGALRRLDLIPTPEELS